MKSSSKIFLVVLLVIVFFNPASLYIVSQVVGDRVIKPSLYFKDKDNSLLRQLRIESYCDPIPCHNIYLVTTKNELLDQDFNYCAYAKINGLVHISGHHASPLAGFGSTAFCDADGVTDYLCQRGETLTKYQVYRLSPYPKKIPLDYYSCGQKFSDSVR